MLWCESKLWIAQTKEVRSYTSTWLRMFKISSAGNFLSGEFMYSIAAALIRGLRPSLFFSFLVLRDIIGRICYTTYSFPDQS